VELIGALLALAVYREQGPTLKAGVLFVFAALLVAITYIDLDHWVIPHELTTTGLVVGIAGSFLDENPGWFASLVGAVAGYLIFALIAFLGKIAFKKEALGMGDWWLLAMIGGFLGWTALLPVILLASLQGSVFGGLILLVGRFSKKNTVAEPVPAAPPEPAPPPAPPEGSADGDEDDWEPDPTALPFGPFLALGALEQLFVGNSLRGSYETLLMHFLK
jgi:leader peptidase (prepilin peptidase)/N-methyltransferase